MQLNQNKLLKGAALVAEQKKLPSESFKCITFEKCLWFRLGKTMWRNSRNVFEEQKRYLEQNITKPFGWTMTRYTGRVRELYPLR
jgi:hypothetical protein